jgi:hypothetical protein
MSFLFGCVAGVIVAAVVIGLMLMWHLRDKTGRFGG